MRGDLVRVSAALLAVASIVVSGPDARACGGCFVPPKQVTVVTDHRMAFSISPHQSVLWDQVEYSGAPQDFAWVLPVMPGTQIQLSHDEFFAALDALTDPVINAPPVQCKPAAGGFGCGGSSNSAAFAPAAAGGGSTGVQVLGQSVIGPYDTATIHSSDPNALEAWLTANSYDIPDAIQPVIAAYVSQGFDFIAMRLAPGQGVQAMQPVRVVFPGASLTLPLRMVAAGVGDQVGLTLYVISEGRYEAQNFPNATFDDSKLVWLSAQSISNYEPLAEGIMQQGGGRTFLTEYSAQNDIETTPSCPTPTPVYSGYGGAPGGEDLANLYFSTCQCDGTSTFGAPDGSTPADAGDSDASDANAPSVPSTSCASFDDLTVAMEGMDATDTWITRLRAILPSNALSEADLVLQASASQTSVSNVHTALVYDDPSYSPCSGSAAASSSSSSASGGGGGCSAAPDDPDAWSRWLVVGSLGFAGVSLGRRRFLRGRRS